MCQQQKANSTIRMTASNVTATKIIITTGLEYRTELMYLQRCVAVNVLHIEIAVGLHKRHNGIHIIA